MIQDALMKFTETTGAISVPRSDYAQLIRNTTKLELLTNALFNAAMLSYREEELRFDSDQVAAILKALDYETYDYKLQALQDAKKSKQPEPMD